jgi:NAD(P)-dependent dehydrogenase (short-subunit alcohol dehydrogenase family)
MQLYEGVCMTRTVDQVLSGVDLTGKVCVITGATSGLGLMTAQGLASAGATVVLAGRDPERRRSAAEVITTETPAAAVETVELELDSLAGVRSAAVEISARFPRVDVLINNAGVMFTPYQQTKDGFELQFGVNHLGHFELTRHLLPLLLNAESARVINLSSDGHISTTPIGSTGRTTNSRPTVRRRQPTFCSRWRWMSGIATVVSGASPFIPAPLRPRCPATCLRAT